LAETEHELREGARSHGWTIGENIEIFELAPPESVLDPDQHQSLLYSSDLELGETVQRIFDAIERLKPKRVVVSPRFVCSPKVRCAIVAKFSR
jgi:circadian clock protein KaiC